MIIELANTPSTMSQRWTPFQIAIGRNEASAKYANTAPRAWRRTACASCSSRAARSSAGSSVGGVRITRPTSSAASPDSGSSASARPLDIIASALRPSLNAARAFHTRSTASVLRLAGEHLEQDRAERVDIGRSARLHGPLELLRRHVARRAEQLALLDVEAVDVVAMDLGDRLADDAREPPIEHVDYAEVAEHHVRGLEIAVDDAARVRELDREADIGERAQQARPRRDRALHQLRQRDAGEPLHREERAASVVGAEVVDRRDRGMIEPRLDPRLAQEPLDLGIRRRRRTQPLERDVAADAQVVSDQHFPEATAADDLTEHVTLERAGGVVTPGPVVGVERPAGAGRLVFPGHQGIGFVRIRPCHVSIVLRLPCILPPMFLGIVKGTVVAERKASGLEGQKILLVQPVDEHQRPLGDLQAAIDTVQAGEGDLVYLVG